MESLKDVLTDPSVRPKVIADAVRLVDEEVASKSGLSGLALKAGYGVFKKVKPGIMPNAVDQLIDDFATAIDPFWQDHRKSGKTGSVSATFVARKREIANALLAITDRKAKKSESGIVKKTYEKLRPTAMNHTEDAIPGVCRLVDRYAPIK